MDKQHPYNKSIESKLAQLPDADAEQLWDGMQAILDKKMPQQKERRRFLGWAATNKTFLFISAASIITACCLVFIYSSPAKTTTNTTLSKFNTRAKQTTPSTTSTPANDKRKNETIAIAQANNTVKETTTNFNRPIQHDTKKANANLLAFLEERHTNMSEGSSRLVANHIFKNQVPKEAQSQLSNRNAYTEMPAQDAKKISASSLHTAFIYPAHAETRNFITPLILKDSTYGNPLRNLLLQQSTATAKSIKKNNSEKGPYVGLLVGVDLSSVQFQSMKTGVNKGLIVGYEFTKRWSIESGLFWNKKRYVGDGSAFHPTAYTLPAGVKMISVNGDCQLYEWPVNVKFTIIPKKNSLFVTAGLSSYYMKTESYHYEYEQNGQSWKSYASYKNETKDWFSVANFSLGYTYQIGSRSSLRVEPYVKLPVRDIGINNMPVVSTGLNVGFTKQILR